MRYLTATDVDLLPSPNTTQLNHCQSVDTDTDTDTDPDTDTTECWIRQQQYSEITK